MRTWHKEALVVGLLLGGVVAATGGRPIEWLCATAVFVTFLHTQVGFRLSEAEGRRSRPELESAVRSLSQRIEHTHMEPDARAQMLRDVKSAEQLLTTHVECHRWLTRYLVLKEGLWLAYFILLNAWSALVGIFIFLLYPLWRRWRVSCSPS